MRIAQLVRFVDDHYIPRNCTQLGFQLGGAGVEDVRTIDVFMALGLLVKAGKDIAADMIALFDDPAVMPGGAQFARADRAVKPCSNNQYLHKLSC